MRIIFIGKVMFSHAILKKILYHNIHVVGVVSSSNKGINSDHADLKSLCLKKGISYFDTKDINTIKTIDWIKKRKPDLILCIGWSQIIKKEILNIPTKYSIGYHPTDLPLNRGRHPLIWSLALGLKEMTSTYFKLSEKVDYGPILSKKNVLITNVDDSGTMYIKLQKVAGMQIIDLLKRIEKNRIKPTPIKRKKTNTWRKRTDIDGKIDWRMQSKSIHNLVRALNKPYDGAYFLFNDKRYKIFKTKIVNIKEKNNEPGKVIKFEKDKPVIMCGENAIKLIKTKPTIKLEIGKYL